METTLGYSFTDESLLIQSLTHSTYANEHPDQGEDYERLEFVGDAVLDLLVAKLLYLGFPDAREGILSRRRARVVCRESLAELARELGMEEALRVGLGQRSAQGGLNSRILADSYESLVGAVYLDGGLAAVERVFGSRLARAIDSADQELDFKTMLQQLCHSQQRNSPEYRVNKISGPDHALSFTCGVWVQGEELGVGTDSSKKGAEQMAAKLACEKLRGEVF